VKLIMTREGGFVCHWITPHGKCGTSKDIRSTYFYKCVIEAKPVLDSNGFLFDQLEIDKYFQRRYRDDPPGSVPRSCENIAMNAVADITNLLAVRMMEEHGAPLDKIIERLEVSIGADSQAMMTCVWEPPKKQRKP
jgi:hypothetical protein